jgi:hypothetical protein
MDAFLQLFRENKLDEALNTFNQLSLSDQKKAFEALFQKASIAEPPLLISVLKRTLNSDTTFEAFREAWLPPEEKRNPTTCGGVTYQQYFPVPTTVFNGENISAPREIISVSLCWAHTKEEQNQVLALVESAKDGSDNSNQTRHDSIKEKADGELIGIYKLKSSDNLGKPF